MRILKTLALAWMLTGCAASPKPCVVESIVAQPHAEYPDYLKDYLNRLGVAY